MNRATRIRFKRSKPAGPTATSVAGLRCGRLRPARLYESQKHSLVRPRRTIRFQLYSNLPPAESATSSVELQSAAWGGGELRGSVNRKSPANSSAQSTAQISAQRGGKTVFGFPAQRTVTAQSTAQFSAPCPPHCGSACAPPLFAVARSNSCRIGQVPTGRICHLKRAGDDFLTESIFSRKARVCPTGGYCPRAGQAPRARGGQWAASAQFIVRAPGKSCPKRK